MGAGQTGQAAEAQQLTLQVARRAVSANEPLPDAVLLLAKQCVLDWVGVALAGAQEPVSRILRAQAAEDGGRQIASAVGGGAKFSAAQAALINGATGHAIDYDDANIGAQGHITTAVLPAALAIAQAHGLSGERMLQAFAAGYHAAGMVGHYVGREHYDRGFHGTGTVGSFGAAVAAALLLGLDAEAVARAMGIAGTQAAGLKAQFGTMCKPFHAGKAAENGVRAAQLAAHGFTSRDDLVEAAQGFGEATSPHCHPDDALRTPLGGHHFFGNLFKYHAACYGTHSAIDAVSALRRQHNLLPAQVRRVELRVEPGADRMCNIPAPQTGLEAKFSLRFNAALALAGEDTASPATYSDANTARADLCELRDAVTVLLMPQSWLNMMAEASIETVDGRVLEGSANSAVPCMNLALQGERLLHKFRMISTPVSGVDRSEAIAAAIGKLETMPDIGRLMSMIE
jgi:2-methylcitrate dehydratase PrpD